MNNKIGPFGYALFFSLFLTLLRFFGIIECDKWVMLLPIMIIIGWYVFLAFIVGILVIILYSIKNSKNSEDNEDTE